MPRHKHAGHRDAAGAASEAPQQEQATRQDAPGDGAATQETGGRLDDIEVKWHKKTSTAQQAQTPEGAEGAIGQPEEEIDWKARYEEEHARAEDLLTKWQRAAADLSNMRRRHEQERQEYTKQANAHLIAALLPVLDSFDRALESMPPHLRELTWIDGIILVDRQLRAVLERAGLTPIEAEGKPFDPNEHEAIMQDTASDKPEDTVTAELQRGYKLHNRVLRPAMVKVAKSS